MDANEQSILLAGHEIKRMVEKACESLTEENELRQVEVDILYFLSKGGEHNTAKDIANSGKISKAHISKSVDNLKQGGYICINEDSVDHRCLHITITDKGSAITREYEKIRKEILCKIFAGVSEGERKQLRETMQKIISNVHSEMGGSVV